MIEGLAQVALTVTDLVRAKEFYGGVLGLTHLYDAGTMAFFQCGSVRLMLGVGEQPGPVGATILYYKVTGIAEAYAGLAKKGVVTLREPHVIARMPDQTTWLAFFKDPDGNLLALMEQIPNDDWIAS